MPQFEFKLAGRCAMLWLALFLLPAPSPAAIDETQAQALYAESGAEQQLKLIARTFPDGIRESLVQHPAGKRFNPLAIMYVTREAFAPAATKPLLLAAIREGLTPEEAKGVLTWLHSDLGRRVTALEVAATEPQAEAELTRYAESLQKELPPESRLVLIQSLDKAIQLTEQATQTAISMTVAASLGTLPRSPDIDKQVLDQLRLDAERDQYIIREAVSEQTFAHLLFAYRSLSDDDLKHYIEFAKSPAAMAYQKVLLRGLDQTLSQATLRLGASLAKLLKSSVSGN